MCNRPDFEGEEQALDERLLSLFHRWKGYTELWVGPEGVPRADLVECFCRDMGDRLPELLHREKKALDGDAEG
jgi:hypothetical protein